MRNPRVGSRPADRVRRSIPALVAGLCLISAAPAWAQTAPPPVSVGAGLQTSYVHTSPDGGDSTDAFLVNSARLYFSGPVTDKVTFMFNTEYDGGTSHIGVIDAVARIAASPKANIWMGRFLPPSDRANLYGPYYSHEWAVYSDGVQDGYPFVTTGRDDGVAYWGQFGKVKLSGGVFDGASATGNAKVLTAARAQVDFWDAEDGYYLNGTYYGGKNLLALGAAVQAQDGHTAATADVLLEKKLPSGGTVSVESEYADYEQLGGYDAKYGKSQGGYVLGAYLFPKPTGGMGTFEVLGKFAKATFRKGVTAMDADYDQKTTEINVNYILKEFNARVMFFFKNTDFTAIRTNSKQFGVGLQIQM
jgi:hypothetical protein